MTAPFDDSIEPGIYELDGTIVAAADQARAEAAAAVGKAQSVMMTWDLDGSYEHLVYSEDEEGLFVVYALARAWMTAQMATGRSAEELFEIVTLLVSKLDEGGL